MTIAYDHAWLTLGDPWGPISPPVYSVTLSGSVSDTTATLTWTASPETVTGYRVWRDGVLIYDGSALTIADPNLTPAALYRYTVAPYNTAGEGPVSNKVDLTVPLPAGPSVTLLPVSDYAAPISWSTETGATGAGLMWPRLDDLTPPVNYTTAPEDYVIGKSNAGGAQQAYLRLRFTAGVDYVPGTALVLEVDAAGSVDSTGSPVLLWGYNDAAGTPQSIPGVGKSNYTFDVGLGETVQWEVPADAAANLDWANGPVFGFTVYDAMASAFVALDLYSVRLRVPQPAPPSADPSTLIPGNLLTLEQQSMDTTNGGWVNGNGRAALPVDGRGTDPSGRSVRLLATNAATGQIFSGITGGGSTIYGSIPVTPGASLTAAWDALALDRQHTAYCSVAFYSAAGGYLSALNMPVTGVWLLGTWSRITTSTITVPANAATAELQLAALSMQVDDRVLADRIYFGPPATTTPTFAAFGIPL